MMKTWLAHSYLRNKFTWLLVQFLACSSVVILLFKYLKSFSTQTSINFQDLSHTLWYGLSESLGYLLPIALFIHLKRIKASRELHLMQLYQSTKWSLFKCHTPLLVIVFLYQLLYFGFLKPDIVHRYRNQSPLSFQTTENHRMQLFNGNYFWSKKENNQLLYPTLMFSESGTDTFLQADEAMTQKDFLVLKNGFLVTGDQNMPLLMTFKDGVLPTRKNILRNDKMKNLLTLSCEVSGLLRIQRRLLLICTPLVLCIFTFSCFHSRNHLYRNQSWVFLAGIFLIYLPIQLVTRKLTYEIHELLVLCNWLAPLALWLYAVLSLKLSKST